MPPEEITELRQHIGELRQCIGALRTRFGDTKSVSRLVNDVDRLDIDASELEESPPQPIPVPVGQPEIIYVPDSKSDEAAWMGAQDEGLGFHSRKRTR